MPAFGLVYRDSSTAVVVSGARYHMEHSNAGGPVPGSSAQCGTMAQDATPESSINHDKEVQMQTRCAKSTTVIATNRSGHKAAMSLVEAIELRPNTAYMNSLKDSLELWPRAPSHQRVAATRLKQRAIALDGKDGQESQALESAVQAKVGHQRRPPAKLAQPKRLTKELATDAAPATPTTFADMPAKSDTPSTPVTLSPPVTVVTPAMPVLPLLAKPTSQGRRIQPNSARASFGHSRPQGAHTETKHPTLLRDILVRSMPQTARERRPTEKFLLLCKDELPLSPERDEKVRQRIVAFAARHRHHKAHVQSISRAMHGKGFSPTRHARINAELDEVRRNRFFLDEPLPPPLPVLSPRSRKSHDKELKKPPWQLEHSIWAGRPRQTDSRDFYDTDTVVRRAVETDFRRALERNQLRKFLLKNDPSAPDPSIVEVDEMEDYFAGVESILVVNGRLICACEQMNAFLRPLALHNSAATQLQLSCNAVL